MEFCPAASFANSFCERTTPGGGTPGHGRIDGNSQSIPRDALPAHLFERLHTHNIHSLQDWRLLGRGRFKLWGITRAMVRVIDAAAKEEAS